MFAIAIPTLQYKFTNHELYRVASASLGIPNPVCSPHMGTRLVRTVPEEDQDDADMMRGRGTRSTRLASMLAHAHSKVCLNYDLSNSV